MPIKSVKMKISKNKKMRFFLMSQGSLSPKIRFLAKKLWSVTRIQRHRQTRTKVNTEATEGTLSRFQEFFLQPIIKDRPNIFICDVHHCGGIRAFQYFMSVNFFLRQFPLQLGGVLVLIIGQEIISM